VNTRRPRSDRFGRGALRSPGRPSVARRENQRQFWVLITAGRLTEDAAVGAGVSPAVGARWFRRAGGMPPSQLAPSSKPLSGRYLSFAEREEVALWRMVTTGEVPAGVVLRAALRESKTSSWSLANRRLSVSADDLRWRSPETGHGLTPFSRMGPPPEASPPMRMTALWSGPCGPTEYKVVAR
jgi:hypothetical protein